MKRIQLDFMTYRSYAWMERSDLENRRMRRSWCCTLWADFHTDSRHVDWSWARICFRIRSRNDKRFSRSISVPCSQEGKPIRCIQDISRALCRISLLTSSDDDLCRHHSMSDFYRYRNSNGWRFTTTSMNTERSIHESASLITTKWLIHSLIFLAISSAHLL